MMNNKKKAVLCTLLLCAAACLVLTACTSDKPISANPSGIPTSIESANKGTVTPTPSPLPTPIVDRPADRNDFTKVSRAYDKEVLNETIEDVSYIFNPFYADAAGDKTIEEDTQLKLLFTDDKGQAFGGVEYPCLAYSVEKMSDADIASKTDYIMEDGEVCYRIVLKEGVCFADGTPITADDVIYSLKTISDDDYSGPGKVHNMAIRGMDEYHTQILAATRETADKYAHMTAAEEGNCPDECDDAEQWADVWQYTDEAGTKMAEDIVKYVNETYPLDAYVQTYLSTKLTYSHIAADESLQVLYAMRLWGGYAKKYTASDNTMTDMNGEVHKLSEQPLTAADFWALIRDFYGNNYSAVDGINYESPFSYSGKYFEDYLAECYCENNKGVEEISGITVSEENYPDGAHRTCIDVIMDSTENIADFNFFVAEKKLYEGNEKSNSVVGGAGRYLLVKVSEEAIELTANEDYLLGSPEYKNLVYYINNSEEKGEESDEVDEADAGDNN